jgi:V/A-type H+-transporting ATPase subunit I
MRQRQQLSVEVEEGEDQLRWYRDWGKISPKSIEALRAAGISVRFHRVDENGLEELAAEQIVHVGKKVGGVTCIAIIGEVGTVETGDAVEEIMPEEEPEELESRIESDRQQLAAIEAELATLASERKSLLTYFGELDHRLEVSRVERSMGLKGVIAYVEGYCPAESIEAVETVASSQGWGWIFEDPEDPNQVPVLVRRPRWLRVINPVFKFMGTTPGYTEYDISFWFMISFSLFFAILIGDAGYGLLFLLVNLWLMRKFPAAPKEPFRLLIILSATTICWGAITGTWFGYRQFAQLPFLQALVVDEVNSFVAGTQPFMMYLCFIIGAVHLTIARLTAAVRRITSLTALGELGWIGIIWFLFFLAGDLVIDRPIPTHMIWSLVGGVVLVMLFTDPQRNVLKGALITLANLPLKLVGSFSDIVSYLRLFAVGYASVVVASSFNDMALGIGYDSVIGGIAATGVLLIGHAMNVTLGIMAVIVHGIRLNMLEFSGHLGMQWSGKPYRPFGEPGPALEAE